MIKIGINRNKNFPYIWNRFSRNFNKISKRKTKHKCLHYQGITTRVSDNLILVHKFLHLYSFLLHIKNVMRLISQYNK